MPEPCNSCAANACRNREGQTWDVERDERAVCPCWVDAHYEDPYDRVVLVDGHRHSEPIYCVPDCEAYLAREQMAALPDVRED